MFLAKIKEDRMRLTIVEMDEFYIAGIEIGLGVDWDEYFEAPDPVLSEIDHVINPHVFYYFSIGEKEIIGKQVSSIENLPDGCVAAKVPAGLYAKVPDYQVVYVHDMFSMTNYILGNEDDCSEYRKFVLGADGKYHSYTYNLVEYSPDVVNVRQIPVLPEARAKQLRKQYIETYFDVDSTQFRRFLYNRYVSLHRGYLWEFLSEEALDNMQGMSREEATNYLKSKQEVLFFWDTSSPLGKKFTSGKVFTMDAEKLMKSYTRFTFDMYLFDSTLDWTIVFAHEEISDEPSDCYLIYRSDIEKKS
jgi:hypothetical protein